MRSKIYYRCTMRSKIYYRWQTQRRLWALAFATRLQFGAHHAAFTRTWSFGPVTVALTDLDCAVR